MDELLDLFSSYLAVERGLSANTLAAYNADLVDLSGYLQNQGLSKWQEVTRDHLLTYLEALGESLSHRSRSRRLAAIRDRIAEAAGRSGIDPVADADRFHEQLVSDRYRLRQELAVPRLARFKAWLDSQQAANGGPILPKSPMGQAITYAMNQWDALCLYTTDGRLNIDNNAA